MREGVVSGESATGNGLHPSYRPLALEPSPKKAHRFEPTGGACTHGLPP